MPDTTYQPKIYKKDGGNTQVVASGGVLAVETGGDITVNGVSLIDEVAALSGLDSGELGVLNGVTAGTVTAGKAVVTTTNKHIDALVISDGGLALGSGAGTAITATAAELNYNDITTLGTGAASKAVVLDAGEDYTWPATGVLTYGVLKDPAGTTLGATVAEINQHCDESANTEVVTTTNVITAAESGKTFYLNAAGGFTSTLPAPAAGLRFRFIVKTAPTTAYIITTDAGADVLYGMMLERAGTAGVAGAARDTFNFVANQSIIGDWVEFYSDGTNYYYHGMVDVAAGNTVAAT